MIAAARSLLKVLLGETLVLPGALAVALLVAFTIRISASGTAWWHWGGGFVLLALVIAALTSSLRLPRSRIE